MPPALEAQSLNHWTTRDALTTFNSQGTAFVFSLRTQKFPVFLSSCEIPPHLFYQTTSFWKLV